MPMDRYEVAKRIDLLEKMRELTLKIADGYPLACEYLVTGDEWRCRETLGYIQIALEEVANKLIDVKRGLA